MALEIRTITDDEIAAYRESMIVTFGDDAENDSGAPERIRALCAPAQLWAAFDRGVVVGTAGTFDLGIVVPGGGQLAMAGLTMVSVRPTHRRRGILKELMRLHFEDARARGFAISGLWASEASIYGRFGYGIAVEGDEVAIADGRAVKLADGEVDEIEWADDARARRELPEIYARALAERPGVLARSAVWWRERRFLETGWMRGRGTSRRRHVVAMRGGERVGYLVYRQKGGLSTAMPSGKVEIVELVGVDARAERTLWRFALNVDLFPGVRWWNAPVDDILPWIVADQAMIERKRSDTMWLRIDDVAAALAARRYAVDGVLRFAIEDRAWELIVEGGRGMCEARPDPSGATLRMGRAALGSLYLGGVGAALLARAGQITGEAAEIALAARMLASERPPWCPEIF